MNTRADLTPQDHLDRAAPDAPVTARPAPESRWAKVANRFVVVSDDHLPFDFTPTQTGEWIVRWAESAGLLVLDPSSDELERRVFEAVIEALPLDEGEFPGNVGDAASHITRAVLSALAAPGGASDG